jgi:lysophospholipase L1-like esterase
MLRRHLLGLIAGLTAAAVLVAPTAPAQAGSGHHPPGHHHRTYDEYVALGDSYTAAPLVPTLDVAGGCYRSTSNYPSLIAESGRVEETVDRSCSGAQTADMTGTQQTDLGPVVPQFDALSRSTDLVTVSIGGNDESVFGTLVGYCPTLRATDPTGDPCREAMNAGGSDRLLDAVDRTRQRIADVITGIHQRSPHARILVVGYPQIAPRHGTCPDLLPLADGDYRYAVRVNWALDEALRRAAHARHAEYVDVWRASRGHDICSDDPWINGQYTDPDRAQNFHPFAEEQAAVARLVVRTLDHRHSRSW